jgi:hypothetical protein
LLFVKIVHLRELLRLRKVMSLPWIRV